MTPSDQAQEVKRKATALFEEWAEHYDNQRVRTAYFQTQLSIAFNMLGNRNGRLLDIGCAAGGEITELRARNFRVVGIDISPQMLLFASRRFAKDAGVQFCRADADRLPFVEHSMDHVMCLGVFEFLPDHGKAVREIHRVMRPGGVAVFAIPSAISIYNVVDVVVEHSIGPVWRGIKRLFRRDPATPAQGGNGIRRNLCVPWRYRALLRENGFELEQSAYSNFFIYPLDRISDELNERVSAFLEPASLRRYSIFDLRTKEVK
jgi:ubiquinone/menaquinone biosynthesis C-methylase UbiE